MRIHKKWKGIFLFLMAVWMMWYPAIQSYANQTTSYTYAEDGDGHYVRTQDAYLPDMTLTELGLSAAEDVFIDKNDMIYIADTGNRRIVKYDIKKGQIDGILESSEFTAPRGVYVTSDGTIYVADSGSKAVLIFAPDFTLIDKLTKPDTPIFADTNYEPKRIAVDSGGNIYLIGEGVYNGVIQLARTGEFLGYFAVNHAKLTFSQMLQHMFFTRDQLANLLDINPTVFTNVFVDDSGVVYTATSGTHRNGMKKHSTNGGNMFKSDIWSLDTLTDLYVDKDGLIYTCSSEGYIVIYSRNGEEIFEFGSYVTTVDIAGLFTNLVSVAVDSNGNIWALDGSKSYLQSFKPSDYAQMVYRAINLYEEGRYEEAMRQWNEVLRLNQMSVLAHDGVGKAYLHAQEYDMALEHFEVANDKPYYSEAFWEVRNAWLQKNLGKILLILLLLIIIYRVLKVLDKKHGRMTAVKKRIREWTDRTPVIRDFAYALHMPRHPVNDYYEIRKNRRGSVLAATIIYGLFFIDFMAFKTCKGFIYQQVAVKDMDISSIVIGFFLILGLFIICNYLVTSINDGDGTFRQIYLIPAYGMMPAMIALLAVTVLSYGMTYNESFLLTIILIIGVMWSGITIFLGLQTVHDYTFRDMIKSILLTVVFMIIIAVIGIIISIMWDSLYTFLSSFGKEMIQNVM